MSFFFKLSVGGRVKTSEAKFRMIKIILLNAKVQGFFSCKEPI